MTSQDRCPCCKNTRRLCMCWGSMITDKDGNLVSKTCKPEDHVRKDHNQ